MKLEGRAWVQVGVEVVEVDAGEGRTLKVQREMTLRVRMDGADEDYVFHVLAQPLTTGQLEWVLTDEAGRVDEVVAALDALDGETDPERDHSEADKLLLGMVPARVAKAYERLKARALFWAAA